MALEIAQLKARWSKEKASYKFQEVGSGVQEFVKNVLECKELFNLREGKLSTPSNKRKNEFICEYKTKERRRVDIAIFITPEILIPIEVEQYTSIKKGVYQLLQYQLDLEKKYGILTDGYTWRFYNNNLYREFNLEQIFGETDTFLEFWKEYIKPEFYYLAFFESIGQLPLFKEERLPVESNRQLFFEDITGLIRSFKNKLNIEGYFEGLEKKEKEKKAVEITYAYIIQFILYKTLVDNAFDDFPKEYNDKCQKIHEYLKTNRYKDILGVIDGISSEISKNIYRPFVKEQEFIFRKLSELYRVENKLSDVSPWLDIFVFVKKYNFANIQNEIFGYIYENYLKELYEDEKKGQYFTDPAVVNFMIEQIGYTPIDIKERLKKDKDSISLIDPACGSGTFIYSATDSIIRTFGSNSLSASKQIEELVTNNIFGLDIAEFPLYLAEMNILMRMLPLIIGERYNKPVEKKIKVFKTNDSVAEFMDTALRNTLSDMSVEYERNNNQMKLFTEKLNLGYSSYVRDEDDLKEMKKSLENLPRCPRRRFDYVIANPPYISYNECCKQGVLIFDLIKEGRVKLNNIYGVNLHSIPIHHKKYAPKPNLYAFFITVGLALLKDNGKLCYIIPQTILSNPDSDVIRYHLAKFTTIEKIIIFSTKMFVRRGLRENKAVPTSSLVFVVTRRAPDRMHEVEVITYKDPNDTVEKVLQNISSGKKIIKKKIPQNKLLQNAANWNFIKQTKEFLEFYSAYQRNTEDMMIYYNHTMAENRFGNRFYIDGGGNIKDKFITNSSQNAFEIFEYKQNDYYQYTTSQSNKYYPEKAPVTFPHGSQGIETFHQKYKIIWRTKGIINFQFIDRYILLISNRFLTISSNNKKEIIFLVALLNSPTVRLILEKNLKQELEKAYLVAITGVKNYVRIPRIGKHNQYIKDEVIKRTEEMLALEERTLSDFVDFSNIMVQKFNGVSVEKDALILTHENEKIKLKIKSDVKIIAEAIREKFYSSKLIPEKQKISLSELKNLTVIDLERQKELKENIDDLVFALYFNVHLGKIGVKKTNEIQVQCAKSSFYKVLKDKHL